MSEIRQGEVYWIDFGPVYGSSPALRHPCVIVQSDLFNRTRIETSVVCLITSNTALAGAPGNVLLKKGEGGLSKPSVVNVSQILTVNRSELTEKVGRLTAGTMNEVLRGLGILFERV